MAELESSGRTVDWGWVIFLILILWFFVGGNNFFGMRNGMLPPQPNNSNSDLIAALSANGCLNGSTNCEVERRDIINTAATQFLIEQRSAETNAIVQASTNSINSKIDMYQYEAQKEKVADLKMENMFLKGQLADSERFNALDNRLNGIESNMAKAPKTYPYSYICPSPCVNPCGGFANVVA